MSFISAPVSGSPQAEIAARLTRWPALLALALGLMVVWGAGFANPASLHNATHDTRHAFGLPCH